MFPRRSEWREWKTLDKIAYVAQLAASLALLPTVIFAYLGWREAHLARADQAEYFLAEKAPRIEISDVSIKTGLLTVELHNVGESLAQGVRLKLTFMNLMDARTSESKPFVGLLDVPFSIAKNDKVIMPITSNVELEKTLGFLPREIRVYTLKTFDELTTTGPTLFIAIDYSDIRGNPKFALASAKVLK